MKNRKLFKRIAALVMSTALMLGMGLTAGAATIDTTQAATLQIEKLKTGTTDAGIAGVQFNYLKVGDFKLDTTGNVNGFEITDNTLKTALINAGLSEVVAGTGIYDGAEIQSALIKALENPGVKEQIEALATSAFNLTGADGKTNVVSLPIGMYLVVEVSAPEAVTRKAEPFILSIPTLIETGGVQSWNYNVVAQPKNDYINEKPDPDKTIENGNAAAGTNNSANIGDEITFNIHSTVPQVAGTLEKFDFIDTMSKGLDFQNVTAVKVGVDDGTGNVTYTDAPVDMYEIKPTTSDPATGKTTLTVSFKPESLYNTTTGERIYTDVKVTYIAKLTEDAVIGIDENSNSFIVDYSNTSKVDAEVVYVDTYGFHLQKNDESGENGLTGATFKLYDEKTGGNVISFYTELDSNKNVITTSKTEQVTTNADGKASFYGLAAGKYYLEEVDAPEGYNLLKERVEVEIQAADTSDDMVTVTIINTKGFTLPATGGMGTVIFTVGGIALMLGATILLIRVNRKNSGR